MPPPPAGCRISSEMRHEKNLEGSFECRAGARGKIVSGDRESLQCREILKNIKAGDPVHFFRCFFFGSSFAIDIRSMI